MQDSSDDDNEWEPLNSGEGGAELSSLEGLLRDAESIMGSSLPGDSSDGDSSVISANALLNTLSHSERISPSILQHLASSQTSNNNKSLTSPSTFLDSVLPAPSSDSLTTPNLEGGRSSTTVDFDRLMAQSSTDILNDEKRLDSDDISFVTAREDDCSRSTMGDYAADTSTIDDDNDEDGMGKSPALAFEKDDSHNLDDMLLDDDTPSAHDNTFQLLQSVRSMEEAPRISVDDTTLEETPKRSGKGELLLVPQQQQQPSSTPEDEVHPPSFEILSNDLQLRVPAIFSSPNQSLSLDNSMAEAPMGSMILESLRDNDEKEGDDQPMMNVDDGEREKEAPPLLQPPEIQNLPIDDQQIPQSYNVPMETVPSPLSPTSEPLDAEYLAESGKETIGTKHDPLAEPTAIVNESDTHQRTDVVSDSVVDDTKEATTEYSQAGTCQPKQLDKEVSELSAPKDGSPGQTSDKTPPNRPVKVAAATEGLVISPLSAPTNATKPTSLQVEFPTNLDSAANKSDAVSLSSASSTISFTSSARGLRLVATSPSNANQPHGSVTGDRKNLLDATRPPRIPKKLGADDPKSLMDSLSNLAADDEDHATTESKYIRQARPTSFNFQKSIFAGKQSSKKDDEISPPGSPPEPVYDFSSDNDDSSGGSQELGSESSSQYQPEYSTWDMYVDPDEINASIVDVSSGGELGPGSSVASTATDNAEASIRSHSENYLTRSHKSDLSHSSAVRKRRGIVRALSYTSRGSGRRSLVSSKESSARVARNSLPTSMSEGIPGSRRRPSLSPPRNNFGEESPGLPSNRSSPDLRRLVEEGRRASKPLSPLKIKRFLSDSDDRPIEDASSSIPMTPESLALATRYALSQDQEGAAIKETQQETQLEEELVAFSSLEPLDLPFRYTKPLESLDYVGSIRWRQLVACWEHSEMMRCLTVRDPSPHFDLSHATGAVFADEWSDSIDRNRKGAAEDLVLNDVSLSENKIDPSTKNFGGFSPLQRGGGLQATTRFLAELGGASSSKALHHELTATGGVKVVDIVRAAESELEGFRTLVHSIAAFATRDSSSRENIAVSIGIKSQTAVEHKATMKYSGNVLQVKDVLRARMVFPDDGSLICGLIGLNRLGHNTEQTNTEASSSELPAVKICRVKNLFGSSVSPLPTNYRHVLVNLRLRSGLLAELQFNLRPLFDILGDSGHHLHREISELQFIYGDRFDEVIKHAVRPDYSTARGKLFDTLLCTPIRDTGIDCKETTSEDRTKNEALEYSATALAAVDSNPNETQDATDGAADTSKGSASGSTDKTEENPSEGDTTTSLTERVARTDVDSSQAEEKSNQKPIDENKINPSQEIAPSNDQAATGGDSSVISQNEPPTILLEARKSMLDTMKKEKGDLQSGDVFLSILEHGSLAGKEKPRDVGTFYCLYLLFSFVSIAEDDCNVSKLGFGIETIKDVSAYAQRCLMRCLVISNQATSTGMTGWLEYGRSSPFDRLTDRPFVLLQRLAYDLGQSNEWDEAEGVLATLVMHSEQHLPLYHPVVLTALLDLAIVSSHLDRVTLAERLISRVAGRLSKYLLEMENCFLEYLAKCRATGKPGDTVFRIEHDRNALFMLDSFVALFERHMERDIDKLVGHNHEILLINRCLLADSLLVLANCVAASKTVLGGNYDTERSLRSWKRAFSHYECAFQGYIATKGIADPGTARAAYGLARCLREFGETNKALEILSLVVSCTAKQSPPRQEEKTAEPPPSSDSTLCFLPPSFYQEAKKSRIGMINNTSSAMCLWLMATLSLDRSPEEGRDQAFSYLHAASVSLQALLADNTIDETTKATCIHFLSMIEEEAMQIAEPVYG